MADQAEIQPDFKAKRFRSPPYPSVYLGKAIDRASELHEKAQHHTVPVHVPASAWGYTIKSGTVNSTISALKQFGLLRGEGSGDKRRFTLTSDAIRIINDPDPNSPKRMECLKRAALAPKIHAELWDKFGVAGLSGSMDVALKTYLTLDRKDLGEASYSPTAVDELIEEYKATIAFAGLTNSDIISGVVANGADSDNLDNGDEADDTGTEDEFDPRETHDRRRNRRRMTLMEGERELTTGLLSKDAGFRLIVTGKIGAKEIDRLIAKLELDKEILAEADDDPG